MPADKDLNKDDVASLKESATCLVSTLQSLPGVESAMRKSKASEVTDTNLRSLKIHRIIYVLCSLGKSHRQFDCPILVELYAADFFAEDVQSWIKNSSLLTMLVDGVKRPGTSHIERDALLRGIFTVVHRGV